MSDSKAASDYITFTLSPTASFPLMYDALLLCARGYFAGGHFGAQAKLRDGAQLFQLIRFTVNKTYAVSHQR